MIFTFYITFPALGVAYVKYSKMSEAALAMEKLNNTSVKNHSGTYKVYIAKRYFKFILG